MTLQSILPQAVSYWWIFIPLVLLVVVPRFGRAILVTLLAYAAAIGVSVVAAGVPCNWNGPCWEPRLIIDFVMLWTSLGGAVFIIMIRFVVEGIRGGKF